MASGVRLPVVDLLSESFLRFGLGFDNLCHQHRVLTSSPSPSLSFVSGDLECTRGETALRGVIAYADTADAARSANSSCSNGISLLIVLLVEDIAARDASLYSSERTIQACEYVCDFTANDVDM